MKRIFVTMLAVLAVWCAVNAVPAKPGFRHFTQSDGSQITVQLMGDEFFHFFITQDGLPVDMDDNGDFHYITTAGTTQVMAHNQRQRTSDELIFIAQQQADVALEGIQNTHARRAAARAPRKVGETQVPTMGSPRVPIILVEYTDKKMSNTKEQFEAHYKTEPKSVLQYFTDQSNGKYTPQYDIYGIYGLDNNRATYGGNDSNGDDRGVARMVGEAIDKAGDDIDWSLYDNDGDGEADVCIVVYAGVGEAQSSVRNAVWPCQWELSSGSYWGDGTGARHRNNVTIDRFAVFNETYGSSDYGTAPDGIGVFCHEFSHCLGLPDFYCTTYSGYFGMGDWSVMDGACYNGGTISGDTPLGYSAYEKNFMGWIDYVEAVEDTHYTLPIFNSGGIEADQAIRVVSHLNNNEYFILENRHKQGWDQYMPDEGVLITHFTYVASRWEDNSVNNQSVQLATVVPADNSLSSYNQNKDLYGETNHEFTATSTPAAKLYMTASGSVSGSAGYLNKPITEITINTDGTASLWYMKAPAPLLTVTPTTLSVKAQQGKTATATFHIKGVSMPNNVVVSLNDEQGVFGLSKTEFTPEEVKTMQTVSVTFTPQDVTTYTGQAIVACEGVDTIVVQLNGEGQIIAETPVMQPVDTTSVTPTSFCAQWTDATPIENVKSYTLYVDYVRPVTLAEQLQEADFSQLTQVMTDSHWFQTYKDVGGDEADQYLPQGWHANSPFYITNGAILLGDSLTTSTYDIASKFDKISVVVDAWSHNVNVYGNAFLTVTANGSQASASRQMFSTSSSFTYVLDATSVESLTFKGTNFPMISCIKVYAGDVNVKEDAPLLAVIEQGDQLTRVIEGITDHQYMVENLMAGSTYKYRVKTLYINDTHSAMSNTQRVTLPGKRGDVNGDGTIDIADVNTLINIMLGKDNADNYGSRAYVTDDSTIDISDVNAVINLMLGE